MGSAPENTLASFQRGLEEGADFIELDVHLSRDGEVVVIHDDRVDRTTNGEGEVRTLTVKELKRLDAGAWFHPAFRGERVPRLLEVLMWAASKRCWNGKPLGVIIELKTLRARTATTVGEPLLRPPPQAKNAHLSEGVMQVIQAAKMEGRVMVISFDSEALTLLKRHHPEQTVGWLYSRRWTRPLARSQALPAQVLFPRLNRVSRRLVQGAHRKGLAVATWTLNMEREMAQGLRLGVDAIATNYPGRLRHLVDRSLV